MIKNKSATVPFFLYNPTNGQGATGATSISVYVSKDGGEPVAATNTASEVSSSKCPGIYKIVLTAAEMNADVIVLSFAHATYAAMPLTITTEDKSDLAKSDALSTVSSNVSAVKAKTDNLPASPAATSDIPSVQSIQSGLATSDALSAVGTNVSAVKAKTDNLPASPAAVGSEMALTSAAVSAVQSGLATGTNVSNAQTAIINRGNEAWKTADVAGALLLYGAAQKSDVPSAADNAAAVNVGGVLSTYGAAKTSDVPTAEAVAAAVNVTGALTSYGAAKTSDVPTAEAIWSYPDRELTSEIVIGISAQNIKDITDSVWDAPDRTLTDLKPKPNGKNIVCTPTNVTNAYGVPRLENWTNETSGTTAFDEKIETYITLAKEKMATDLNDHINAAIDYIGADNITELCAWLTGYNLYKDDESTDTDSLPETRYNQYLEQIHRIMENI